MKATTEVNTIVQNKPDSLFIMAISFEDRCLGSVRRMTSFQVQHAVLFDFESRIKQSEGELQRKMNAEELKSILFPMVLSRLQKPLRVRPHDPIDMIAALEDDLRRHEIDLGGANVSLDITCFTKVQLLYLVKWLLTKLRNGSLRILYTLPQRYRTERGAGHLSYGYCPPLYFGVCHPPTRSIRAERRESVAVAMLGHEGSRILQAWNDISPGTTQVIRATSGDRDVMSATEENNSFFFRQTDRGNPAFQIHRCMNTDIGTCRNLLGSMFERHATPDRDVRWTVIPMGPKPFVVSLAIVAAEGCPAWVDLVYPIPTAYDAHYSEGFRDTFTTIVEVRHDGTRLTCTVK